MAKKKPAAVEPSAPAVPKIPVHCAFKEMRPLETLVENPRNPNKHPENQLKLLSHIIAAGGWRSPIVVSKRSGFIVKGHGRFKAALMAGMTEVPVDVQDYKTEADEYADMIADNRLAELSDMSGVELKDLLQEIDTGAFDMTMTGFDEDALAALMTEAAPPGEFPTADENIPTEHQCPKCGYKWSGGASAPTPEE